MSREETIEQLTDLKEHCENFRNVNGSEWSILADDVQALNIAIRVMEKYGEDGVDY